MTHDTACRAFDPAHDLNLKLTAISLISMLPPDLDDAERVLVHAGTIIETVLRAVEPGGSARRNVLSLVRQDASGAGL